MPTETPVHSRSARGAASLGQRSGQSHPFNKAVPKYWLNNNRTEGQTKKGTPTLGMYRYQYWYWGPYCSYVMNLYRLNLKDTINRYLQCGTAVISPKKKKFSLQILLVLLCNSVLFGFVLDWYLSGPKLFSLIKQNFAFRTWTVPKLLVPGLRNMVSLVLIGRKLTWPWPH